MFKIPSAILVLLLAASSQETSAAAAETATPVGLPTLFLIGDSTVKNGRGDGAGGLWGWGQVLERHFDTDRLRVENRALGGRSSRTYLTEGLWDRVLEELAPGDFVLIQFGHNDGGQLFTGNRPRASLKGTGEAVREGIVEQTGRRETVHTYGWYLRRYLTDTRAAGATPIVLSPVPRNIWRQGSVARASGDYGRWAKESAETEGAAFIDLNELVALTYEGVGPSTVQRDYFTAQDHTHTTEVGAHVNAACVVAGIRGLADCPLRAYLRTPPANPVLDDTGAVRCFDFGDGPDSPGCTPVPSSTPYSTQQGYGFDLETQPSAISLHDGDALTGDGVTCSQPFFFSIQVPEGNYQVAVHLGAPPQTASTTTIKAESRRLMVESIRVPAGETATCTFTVNVRTPDIATGGRVRLKDRERGTLHWDDKLTLEFNGAQPTVTGLTIRPAPETTTVYLLGDSTVTDQPFEPWNSWGQMLPRFFGPEVAVANHAESGESILSSLSARRFDKVFSTLRSGDYVFLQFGHNDMKNRSPEALSLYRTQLVQAVTQIQDRGATPVLVTSMERKAGVGQDTLGEYPATVRSVAQDHRVPLIDLHQMSKVLYLALGDNLDRAFVDGTHHNNYGSYELARCVVEGIRRTGLPLAAWLRGDTPSFDPASPDSPADFHCPPSPQRDPAQPQGN